MGPNSRIILIFGISIWHFSFFNLIFFKAGVAMNSAYKYTFKLL
jgi:hypothetical protein